MLYLFRILIIFGVTTLNLSSSELVELKNNFYINLDGVKLKSLQSNSEESLSQSGYLYGLGYLRQFDDFYIGASLKFFPSDKLVYSATSEGDKNVAIQRERDVQLALQVKYNFFEFENIKVLMGIDFGYQLNSLSMNYMATRRELIREEERREFALGELIDKSFWSRCSFSGGSENVDWDYGQGQGRVIGEGVYCTTYNDVEKEFEYSDSTELIQTSLPISINVLMLYGLSPNIDLGVGVGISIIENLNVSYANNFIKLNHKQAVSYYNLHFLINYKFVDRKR